MMVSYDNSGKKIGDVRHAHPLSFDIVAILESESISGPWSAAGRWLLREI
jgi:hypothetical protein